MKPLLSLLLITTLLCLLSSGSCKREPFQPDFEHAGGIVIGKEFCNPNPDEDYWLIDLNHDINLKNYGDTLTIQGIFYQHLIKTKQLLPAFKQPGKKVSFDFHLSATKIATTHCAIATPITYDLKEMTVIASGEIW